MQNITELFVIPKAPSSHERKVFVPILMYQKHYHMWDSAVISYDCKALTQITSEATKELNLPKKIYSNLFCPLGIELKTNLKVDEV